VVEGMDIDICSSLIHTCICICIYIQTNTCIYIQTPNTNQVIEMLAALPLGECQDKGEADRRLQEMGACVILCLCLYILCTRSFHLKDGHERSDEWTHLHHPTQHTYMYIKSPGLTDPGMRAFALTNLVAPPEGGVRWQINLEGIRRCVIVSMYIWGIGGATCYVCIYVFLYIRMFV
jgi:hypothetical protein